MTTDGRRREGAAAGELWPRFADDAGSRAFRGTSGVAAPGGRTDGAGRVSAGMVQEQNAITVGCLPVFPSAPAVSRLSAVSEAYLGPRRTLSLPVAIPHRDVLCFSFAVPWRVCAVAEVRDAGPPADCCEYSGKYWHDSTPLFAQLGARPFQDTHYTMVLHWLTG